ncbi:hypothetical protein [Methylobacterium iners]|nr:hypothetical protein [Methylobacterium iners]
MKALVCPPVPLPRQGLLSVEEGDLLKRRDRAANAGLAQAEARVAG